LAKVAGGVEAISDYGKLRAANGYRRDHGNKKRLRHDSRIGCSKIEIGVWYDTVQKSFTYKVILKGI
jgi:hypothetical protein